MMDATRTAQTYRFERQRAVAQGVLETASTTFLLLVAVRWYEAGAMAKALVAAGGSVGLFLSPLLVSRVEASGQPVARAASRLAAFGAACFLLVAVFPLLPVFVIGSMLALACTTAVIPLLTQIYQENYPEAQRGKLFSRTFMIRIAAAAVFSEIAGRALSGHIQFFQWLLVVFAGALAFSSYCLARTPSRPLTVSGGTHPFRALRHAWQDRLFRQTLVSWMFLGFGTLMMVPLRVEYLANPIHGATLHGLPLTAASVALLTGVIPNLVRLVLSPLWGWLFDRMNFFILRIVLNIGFALGAVSFFVGGEMVWFVVGAVLFGIANSGADVAWGLWVTKFAPPDRVADYMSVHTCFTGFRGLVAPLVAFQLVAGLPLHVMGWICAGLILIGTTVLFPEIKYGRKARRAAPLVEDFSE